MTPSLSLWMTGGREGGEGEGGERGRGGGGRGGRKGGERGGIYAWAPFTHASEVKYTHTHIYTTEKVIHSWAV